MFDSELKKGAAQAPHLKASAAPGDEVLKLPPDFAPKGQVVVAKPEARTGKRREWFEVSP